MRLPNLNGLRAFECAARHLNFRLAADELNLTQGAVAQQVRKLEASLGQKLFLRRARGLDLTESGAAYAAAVHRALTDISDATERFVPTTNSVVLSVPPSFASLWLMPRLADFEAQNSRIDLQVMATDRLADFAADGVDLAVRQASPPFPAGLEVSLLAPIDLVAVAAPDYVSQSAPISEFADFAAHRLLEDAHERWKHLFDAANLVLPDRVAKFNQTALAFEMALTGRGVAMVPRVLAGAELARGDLVELWRDPAAAASGYYAVEPRSAAANLKSRRAVRDWLCAGFA